MPRNETLKHKAEMQEIEQRMPEQVKAKALPESKQRFWRLLNWASTQHAYPLVLKLVRNHLIKYEK